MRTANVLTGALAVSITATAILTFIEFAGSVAMASTGAGAASLGVSLGMAASAIRRYQECVTSAPPPAATVIVEVLSWVAALTLIGDGLA